MATRLTLVCLLLLMGCSAAPTPTPPITLTPTIPATAVPDALIYNIDTAQSAVKYLATGPLNAQYPGTLKLAGNVITLLPEGSGYRVKLDVIFDHQTVTATDSFMRRTMLSSIEADKYPTSRLILESKEAVKVGAQAVTFTASGTYDLHGHQQIVELPVTLLTKDKQAQASCDLLVNLPDYNVKLPPVVVNNTVTFSVQAVASQGAIPATPNR